MALLACGHSGGDIVGSWRGMGTLGYNQNVADFPADGSCKSLEGGPRRFCSWRESPGGSLEVRALGSSDQQHRRDLRMVR